MSRKAWVKNEALDWAGNKHGTRRAVRVKVCKLVTEQAQIHHRAEDLTSSQAT